MPFGRTFKPLNQDHLDTLESLIDGASLGDILSGLANISREKAHHVRSNWQDDATANSWMRDAERIEKIVEKISN